MIKQNLVNRIERKYNPEFDIPADPQVTWVDMYLLEIITAQQEQIDKLQEEVKALKERDVVYGGVDEADAMFRQHQEMKEAHRRTYGE